MLQERLKYYWTSLWMRLSGPGTFGRMFTRLATWFVPPLYGQAFLARLSPGGFISPSAVIHHSGLKKGSHVFIGERVVIYRKQGGGSVELGDSVRLHNDTTIETGQGGSLTVGERTYIHSHCQFSAHMAPIRLGCDVQIAPRCAFYPYNHGIEPGKAISGQPLSSKGGIAIDDDAWLGFGVIVLDGVHIGKGAVVGAGSVVTRDVPDGAVAVGVPARVVRLRGDYA